MAKKKRTQSARKASRCRTGSHRAACAFLKGNRVVSNTVLDTPSWSNNAYYIEYCREKPIKKRLRLWHTGSEQFGVGQMEYALEPTRGLEPEINPDAFKVFVVSPETGIRFNFKTFKVTQAFIAQVAIEGDSFCIVSDAMIGFCVTLKDKFPTPEKEIIEFFQGKRKKTKLGQPARALLAVYEKEKHENVAANPLLSLLLYISESVCSVSLTDKTQKLYPAKPKKKEKARWEMTRLEYSKWKHGDKYKERLELAGGDADKVFHVVSISYWETLCHALKNNQPVPKRIVKKEIKNIRSGCPELASYLREHYPNAFK